VITDGDLPDQHLGALRDAGAQLEIAGEGAIRTRLTTTRFPVSCKDVNGLGVQMTGPDQVMLACATLGW